MSSLILSLLVAVIAIIVLFRAEELSFLQPTLKVQLLSENATMPTRGTARSAGLDLYSSGNYTIPAQNFSLIPLDLALEIPKCCYGRMAGRSSLARYYRLEIMAGVIDNDFTGSLSVMLFNHGDRDYLVTKGERIAQLVIEKIAFPQLKKVSELPKTERIGGFGSTGKF